MVYYADAVACAIALKHNIVSIISAVAMVILERYKGNVLECAF